MKNRMPFCPKCKCSIFVGKVKSCDLVKNKVLNAYFCSNCLTEFDKNNNILRPLWEDNSEGEISPWVIDFVRAAKEEKVSV